MSNVGTHPEIAETERNGRPDGEREVIECPNCGKMTYRENIRKCRKCGHETCPMCMEAVHINEWGWDFCSSECAIAYLVEQLQDADAEIESLKHGN
jgi:ribosomal protein L37E